MDQQTQTEISAERFEQLEAEVRRLQEELEELRTRMANTQYIVDDEDTEYIKVSQRIVQLGLIPGGVVTDVLSVHYLDINNRECDVRHPDRLRFIRNLMTISKRLSRMKRIVDGVYPTIRRCDRCNVYTENDYQRFGDNIIQTYFTEHPFNTWGVDTQWQYQQQHHVVEEGI